MEIKAVGKIAIFIDAGNLWSSYKELGKVLNFNKLSDFFVDKFGGEIFKIFYYVACPNEQQRPKSKVDALYKFLTFLKKKLGITVVKKPLKTIFLRNARGDLVYSQDTGEPQSIEKGNLDIEIAIDVIRYVGTYDIAVFFTGDSDFLPLIEYVQSVGFGDKKVYVFSTERCVSRELKTCADGYFDLVKCEEIHGSELRLKK